MTASGDLRPLSQLACVGLAVLSQAPQSVTTLVKRLEGRGITTTPGQLGPALSSLARRRYATSTSAMVRASPIGIRFRRVVEYALTSDGELILDELHASGWSIVDPPDTRMNSASQHCETAHEPER